MELKLSPVVYVISVENNICFRFFQSPWHGPVYLNQGGEGVSEVYREEGRGVGDQTVRASPLPVWIVGDFVGS